MNEERERLEAAHKQVSGLDYTTLNEGIAYALSPGLFHAGQSLAARVASDLAAGKGMDDPYVRFRRYGLALLPLLKEALDDERATLETFLPRALDAWRVLASLETARKQQKKPRGHWFFAVGCPRQLYTVLNKRVYKLHERGVAGYGQPSAAMFQRSQKGDTIVILQALDMKRSYVLPAEYHDLLPKPWAEVEPLLKAGINVELKGEARGFRTILLAAPTTAALEELVRVTEMLK